MHAILDAQALTRKRIQKTSLYQKKPEDSRIRKPIEETTTPLFGPPVEEEKIEAPVVEAEPVIEAKVEEVKVETQQKVQRPERKLDS